MGWLTRRSRTVVTTEQAPEAAAPEEAEIDPGRLAIIAGRGSLPVMLCDAYPEAYCVTFEGTDCAIPDRYLTRHRYEKLGTLFKDLKAQGVERVVMAGGIARPKLDMKQLDMTVLALAPRIMKAMKSGRDDGLLRFVISVFEEQGFAVVGAHELLPELTARPGHVAGPELSEAAMEDIARARTILEALSPVDVGQGCVVAGGLCLGIETVQGTDALLRFVASTPEKLRRGKGIFCKLPKEGQDLRVDMPALGLATLDAAFDAGLEGIAFAAGKTLLLDRDALSEKAEHLGLGLYALEV